MTTKLSSKCFKICFYIQYLLLSISLYLFSSKISFLPWYMPLTTYVLLYILVLTIFQMILLLYTWYMYERQITFKYLRRVCFIHFLLLLLMSFLCILSINWFNLFSFLSTLLIVLLVVYQRTITYH